MGEFSGEKQINEPDAIAHTYTVKNLEAYTYIVELGLTAGWLTGRQVGGWVGKQAGKQVGRQAGRQADRQTGRLAERWAVKIHVRFEILKACSRSKYSIFCFFSYGTALLQQV